MVRGLHCMGVPPHQGQEAQTVRDLLRHAIERARTEDADFARTAGRTPAARLGIEVLRLARIAEAVHRMEALRRAEVDAAGITGRDEALTQGVGR